MDAIYNGRILILANYDVGLYKFRKELIEQLLKNRYEVYISLPDGEFVKPLVDLGCVFIDTPMERRGTNPIRDFKLLARYNKMIKEIRPDYIFTYTIKPNIYGGIVAAKCGIPYIPNVTGLGSAIENNNLLSRFVLLLYKYGFRKAEMVFFQNQENLCFFKGKKIVLGKYKLLPGSGVNLRHFTLQEYPLTDKINFVFISRIMKEKGAEEYLEAAKRLKPRYPNVEFHICGFCEEAYEDALEELQQAAIIDYHGMVKDVRTVLRTMNCVILPSYHEGMSNVLLEAAASGRPLIASDVPGCRETFENKSGGFLVEVRNVEDLIMKIEHFINLPYEKKREMGLAARRYVEEHFDRQKVVEAYMSELYSGRIEE